MKCVACFFSLCCVGLCFAEAEYFDSDMHQSLESVEIADTEPPSLCPEVKPLQNFSIEQMLGTWYVTQYYSSSEEALIYHCMQAEFKFANGRMDMFLNLQYKFVDDPNNEKQIGNMTWTILDPRRPEHWRHTELHSKVVYYTDVLDTDYDNFLLLLHCSDPEPNKRFLSSFILGRTRNLDKLWVDYLREKVAKFNVELDYMFAVNQTSCTVDANDDGLQSSRIVALTEADASTQPKTKKKARRSRGYLHV